MQSSCHAVTFVLRLGLKRVFKELRELGVI